MIPFNLPKEEFMRRIMEESVNFEVKRDFLPNDSEDYSLEKEQRDNEAVIRFAHSPEFKEIFKWVK
ncbi:MAG: hypothetical protein LBM98_08245 [Oscillospiraceae bacterium]|jgi:hypothetical protein|nr:hypothetical protein [Oscillospiraceae bacterium]